MFQPQLLAFFFLEIESLSLNECIEMIIAQLSTENGLTMRFCSELQKVHFDNKLFPKIKILKWILAGYLNILN